MRRRLRIQLIVITQTPSLSVGSGHVRAAIITGHWPRLRRHRRVFAVVNAKAKSSREASNVLQSEPPPSPKMRHHNIAHPPNPHKQSYYEILFCPKTTNMHTSEIAA